MRLQAIDRDAILKQDAVNERSGLTKALRFAVARDVQLAAASGSWLDAGGGARLWVGDVASTGALGIRLHFKDVHLPEGAELAVYAAPDPSGAAGTQRSGFPGFDPERRLDLYQGSEAQASRTDFWTGTQSGERVRIEYLAPAGTDSTALPFAVDSLQLPLSRPGGEAGEEPDPEGRRRSCHNDVPASPSGPTRRSRSAASASSSPAAPSSAPAS